MRFFNTEGPVRPADHYCIPPLTRWDLDQVLTLIEQKRYFLLHAPRQTGKTSCLLALAMTGIVQAIADAARIWVGDTGAEALAREVLAQAAPTQALMRFLTRWSESSPRPLVLLLDEVDALVGDSLIALLRQLRAGYTQRPAHFAQTVVLCGVRDLRDYRIHGSLRSARPARLPLLRPGDEATGHSSPPTSPADPSRLGLRPGPGAARDPASAGSFRFESESPALRRACSSRVHAACRRQK